MKNSTEEWYSCDSIYVLNYGGNEEVDINKLRKELLDYYGTAMASGFGMAVVDLSKVERASDEEIIKLAIKEGLIR